MDEETRCWLAFSVFPGIGPVRFKLLLNYFGSAKKAWEATPQQFREIKLGDKLTEQFVDFRKKFSVSEYIRQLAHEHVSVLTLRDERYPALLKTIPDAPFLLYIKGKKPASPIRLDRMIGVVGTRNITPYGRKVTEELVEGLVAYGFTIVSGLAYGVDAVAHQTAITAGGTTVAVLGCGIDIMAPPCNARLYNEIAGGRGAIVSEMPLGLRPSKGLFPARNRIISGLSLGVLVTEGADDSGALITARNAAEQGRDVFAVPGPITSRYSAGPAKLLKNGAKLVERVEDILDELDLGYLGNLGHVDNLKKPKGDTKEEQKIVDLLTDSPMCIDELVRASELTIQVVGSTITVLEMKGVVKEYGDKVYGIVNG
jgi:DNA processing protein